MSHEVLEAVAITVGVCFTLISYLCWRLHRYALHVALLTRCIARMLRCGDITQATAIAERQMEELKSMGLWKGGEGE